MTDTTISLRIDKRIHEQMKQIEHINWSAILRRALQEQLEKQLQRESTFDEKRARKAARDMDRIRKSGVFGGGKTGTEIIREWRDKRKF
jgi:signal recognition particle GTPase